MELNPSKRLSSLFQNDPQKSASNDSLRYTAPREPPSNVSSQAITPSPAAPSSSIIYNTTVIVYQYNKSQKKYISMGDSSSNDRNPSIGCVVIGSSVTYNLLLYTATKQHLTMLPIQFQAFKPTLQPNLYLNFYDPAGINWSMRFSLDSQMIEFLKCCFLVKIHCEIWGPDKVLSHSRNASVRCLYEDVLYVDESLASIQEGDVVAVSFRCWKVVGSADTDPMDVTAKYAPVQESGGKSGEGALYKMRMGDKRSGSDSIGTILEECVMGMKKGGKRMVLAPPKKTNGDDWYVLDISLVKVKKKQTSSQGRDEPNRKNLDKRRESVPDQDLEVLKAQKRSNKIQKEIDRTSDAAFKVQSKEAELEVRELQLLQQQKELQKALAQEQQQRLHLLRDASMQNPVAPTPAVSTTSLISVPSRPMDVQIMELQAKLDYIIRMMPSSAGKSSTLTGFGRITDVTSIVSGVERLAQENERLLIQINSQHENFQSYEKRCEDMMRQLQQVHEDKRIADQRYQQIMAQQLTWQQELASLTSARDTAVTQTNRLHGEYQQLLNAYYQKQQSASERDQRVDELNFEREARDRLEKELKMEAQGKAIVEQELSLARKQLEVAQKLRDSDFSTQAMDYKNQLLSQSRIMEQLEHKVKSLAQDKEAMEQNLRAEKDKQVQQVVAEWQMKSSQLEMQMKELEKERLALIDKLKRVKDGRNAHDTLELEQKPLISSTNVDEQVYLNQIELLQQRIQELEQDKYQRVQQDLNATDLRSSFLPQGSFSQVLDDREKEMHSQAAAVRDLEKQYMTLYKEALNDMFFQFQEILESEETEERPMNPQQILTMVRKVLKQSTRDWTQRVAAVSLADHTGDETQQDAQNFMHPYRTSAATSEDDA